MLILGHLEDNGLYFLAYAMALLYLEKVGPK